MRHAFKLMTEFELRFKVGACFKLDFKLGACFKLGTESSTSNSHGPSEAAYTALFEQKVARRAICDPRNASRPRGGRDRHAVGMRILRK